jgi:hypothetical protein
MPNEAATARYAHTQLGRRVDRGIGINH